MDQDPFEEWRRYLPHFLNQEDKQALYSELRRFPSGINYFGAAPDDDPLQGDGWRPLLLIDFESGERREVSGLILSNSCDIVAGNTPDHGQNILFAPLSRLEALAQRLETAGKAKIQIDAALDAIRRQEKTDILYLPAASPHLPELFVRLDEIRPQPLRNFRGDQCTRLFTLSQSGFYILLIKLAIHFTRLQEHVPRALTRSA